MTKNRTPTPVYLDPGMHPGLEVKRLRKRIKNNHYRFPWLKELRSFRLSLISFRSMGMFPFNRDIAPRPLFIHVQLALL